MTLGLAVLALSYVLSQFYRAFLAVLTPVLQSDLGAGPEALSVVSGMWFLSFALMQVPVGWALDTIGPRRTAAALLLVGGGGGSALFALATTPLHLSAGMFLIGIGCAPVLMASYYIFARQFPAAQFATLASVMVGVGMSGNLFASYPLALAVEAIGWRGSLWVLAAVSALTALGIWVWVSDPPKPEGEEKGSLRALFRIRVLWLIFPLMFFSYAPVAAIRGLWIGPYLDDVFGADTRMIGQATLIVGAFMILGAISYGPLDRLLGQRKWLVTIGTALTIAALVTLWTMPASNIWISVALMSAICFFGATYAVLITHGRDFLPPHLIGRGMTMLNLCSIGGVGVLQFISGKLHTATLSGNPAAPYQAIFGLFAVTLSAGLVIYLFSRDNRVS
jgi:MFS family permease